MEGVNMEIKTNYELSDKNFIKSESIKKSIILGNFSSTPEKNFIKWTTRYNGNYKKTAAYSIDVAGSIYNHFNPIYYSNITGNLELDKKNIVILLENEGWLVKNDKESNFINWVEHIYNRSDKVLEKKWRNQQYWAPYTEQQLHSVISLTKQLCDEFNIKKFAIPYNTKIENAENFEGVFYKSNLEKYYTDLSPAWPFEDFKTRLEDEK